MPNLPCELLDHIIDLLHDNQITLRNCCLVSKPWVARTRTHLFAEVVFQTAKSLESWKTTFPDPSTSPGHRTKVLLIGGPTVVKTVEVEEGSWIKGFSHVVHLAIVGQDHFVPGWEPTFVQFRGFSPFIKSLRVNCTSIPLMKFSDLVLSFPLLEDLSVTNCYYSSVNGHHDKLPTALQPSSLPVFTGSLELHLMGGTEQIVRGWVYRPGGIHFRKLTLMSFCENVSLMMSLVEKCSHTLESLNIACSGMSIGHLRPQWK